MPNRHRCFLCPSVRSRGFRPRSRARLFSPPSALADPGYTSRNNRKFRTDESDWYVKQMEVLTRVSHVNGWFPAVYLKDIHVSKLQFVSRIEFIRSKLSHFSAHVSGVALALPCLSLVMAQNHAAAQFAAQNLDRRLASEHCRTGDWS